MTDLPRSGLNVRLLRMLFIKAGLTEDDADAFLGRIADEISSGQIADQTTQLEFVKRGFAREVADSLVFMDEGRIIESGTPAAVLDTPLMPRTQAFLSKVRT
jgi:ABC-type arginine transport system ATPase subunit